MKKAIVYDLWLQPYLKLIPEIELPVLDLGCGSGNNTKYLLERNIGCISCDYSATALRKVAAHIPNAKTMLLDIRNPFPFSNDSISCVIADLSLHYFDWSTTKVIMERINNLLVKGGLLLFRVNSVNDYEYGAGRGKEIERHYYKWKGMKKRFFDNSDIDSLIEGKWKTINQKEVKIERYGKTKTAWEIAIRKE